MPFWLRTFFSFCLWCLLLTLPVAFCVTLYYASCASSYDMAQVAALPSRTVFLDRNGRELPSSGANNRRLITRQDLPDFLVKALQAREDARFFEHSGVDFKGLLRATVRNLKDGDFTQGASTLSMQLTRNTYEMRAKSIHRKLLEIALTLRLERNYTKDQILTNYLNRIYFGAGCHGVDTAARTYFGQPVSQLNEGECAMIVGIIRGPHIFSPFRNLDAAREQESQVLHRMVAMNFITESDIARIMALPIRLVPEEARENGGNYYQEAIRKELRSILDAEDIRNGGLTVRTTLDLSWQVRLEADLSEALSKAEKSKEWNHPTHEQYVSGVQPTYVQCAAVTLETKTGGILALIGGRDYQDSRFDRTQSARRDLGNTFEPWIAAAAAERGKLVLPGKPVVTGRQIGPEATIRIAKRCGITGPFNETEDLFRGSVASTPMELATGLATLGSGGNRPHPFLIQSITDVDGSVLYTAAPQSERAISKTAAHDAASLLDGSSGVRTYDGATGSGRDAWLLRLGPKGSTAIWVGFDQPQRISSSEQLNRILGDLADKVGN
jgi:membrane peptidoglycan carboxypeptidase